MDALASPKPRAKGHVDDLEAAPTGDTSRMSLIKDPEPRGFKRKAMEQASSSRRPPPVPTARPKLVTVQAAWGQRQSG